MHPSALRTLALGAALCLPLAASCQKPGTFVSLTVNGISLTPSASGSVTVPLDRAALFNRISIEELLSSSERLRETATLVVRDGVSTTFVHRRRPYAERRGAAHLRRRTRADSPNHPGITLTSSPLP